MICITYIILSQERFSQRNFWIIGNYLFHNRYLNQWFPDQSRLKCIFLLLFQPLVVLLVGGSLWCHLPLYLRCHWSMSILLSPRMMLCLKVSLLSTVSFVSFGKYSQIVSFSCSGYCSSVRLWILWKILVINQAVHSPKNTQIHMFIIL